MADGAEGCAGFALPVPSDCFSNAVAALDTINARQKAETKLAVRIPKNLIVGESSPRTYSYFTYRTGDHVATALIRNEIFAVDVCPCNHDAF